MRIELINYDDLRFVITSSLLRILITSKNQNRAAGDFPWKEKLASARLKRLQLNNLEMPLKHFALSH